MKNTKFVNSIVCPYCQSINSLKVIPIDMSFTEYYNDSVFCTECGRHHVNILKPELEKEVA